MFVLFLLQQNEVTDSAYLGSESTYSECETFTDEDTGALVPPEMHEDVETDSGIEAALHDPEDGGNRSVWISPSPTSQCHLWPTAHISWIHVLCFVFDVENARWDPE